MLVWPDIINAVKTVQWCITAGAVERTNTNKNKVCDLAAWLEDALGYWKKGRRKTLRNEMIVGTLAGSLRKKVPMIVTLTPWIHFESFFFIHFCLRGPTYSTSVSLEHRSCVSSAQPSRAQWIYVSFRPLTLLFPLPSFCYARRGVMEWDFLLIGE